MPDTVVNVSNFARAETDRMFAAFVARGGVNRWDHRRAPTAIDQQDVVRMNRDTLYSSALVDLAGDAVVTIPDAGERYLSVMVVDQDHYVERVLHEPGEHTLAPADFATRYIALAARILVDPSDPTDLSVVNAIQDGLGIAAASAEPFVMPDYQGASFDAIREALKALGAANHGGVARAFGRRDEVDPVLHLIGTAIGWGGLPESEAVYQSGGGLPLGSYRITVGEVPVDAFWSVSVYNRDGFFEPNERGAYNVNSVTATQNEDGTATIHFSHCDDGRPNCLPITEGWNWTARLYRPRAEILDGTWSFPQPEACD